MARSARVVRIPAQAAGGWLEGQLWEAGRPAGGAAVVAPPHPLYGGTMSNPVVIAAAQALSAAGCRTLCFNWRGTGQSQGVPSGEPEDAAADYEAALDALLGSCRPDAPSGPAPATRLVAAGYSFGALAAARVARRRREVGALLLVAPPVGLAGPEEFAGLDLPLAVVVGDADAFAPLAELRRVLAGRAGAHLHVVASADHFFSPLSVEPLRREIAGAIAAARLVATGAG